MNEEEKLSLNNYIDDLYQAMQIGDIVFEPKHSSELYNLINKLQQELQKYKSLYENEKDHTDTLKRIVKEVKETLEKHLTAKSYGNHKYELFGREYLEEILDLLKEIK